MRSPFIPFRAALKAVAFSFFYLIYCLNLPAQTYTFSGAGDWTNASLWLPFYPGTTISPPQTVVIDGFCLLSATTILNNGVIQVTGSLSINPDGIVNNVFGELDISGTVNNLGQIDNVGGFMSNPGGVINNSGLVAASLAGFFDNSGGTVNNNGSITSDDPWSNAGTITGNGSITCAFTNDGVLSPGNSPGILTVNGDLVQSATGSYSVEIAGTGGPGAASGNDQLVVTGQATLDGQVNVSLLNGFVPSVGDVFIVMTFTAASSTASFNFPALPPDRVWTSVLNPTDLSLVVSAVLPVTLTGIQATAEGDNVALTWQTATEHDNAGFQVQHSYDGWTWADLGFVPGHGNSAENHDYRYVHARPLPGIHYYRLEQKDYSGQAVRSPVVMIRIEGLEDVRIFPNPVTGGMATVTVRRAVESTVGLEIDDLNGRTIYRESVDAPAGLFQFPLNLNAAPNGMYVVKINEEGRVVVFRLEKNN
jgi:hypothetical protein